MALSGLRRFVQAPYTPIDSTGGLFAPLVLSLSLGVGLAACNNTDPVKVPVTKYVELPSPVVQVTQAGTEIASTPIPAGTSTLTPTYTCTATLTPSPTPGTVDEELRLYGAKFSGNWSSPTFKSYTLSAVKKVAIRLSEQPILPDCPQAAFKKVFDGLEFVWGCSNCSAWALSYGTKIEFVDLYPN